MQRALAAGTASGLLSGLYFMASYLGWAGASDLVGGGLLALLLLAAFFLPAWAPTSRAFRDGLAFGASASVALLLSWVAMATIGFWAFAPDRARVAVALVALLLVFALAAALLASLTWLGSRVLARRAAA